MALLRGGGGTASSLGQLDEGELLVEASGAPLQNAGFGSGQSGLQPFVFGILSAQRVNEAVLPLEHGLEIGRAHGLGNAANVEAVKDGPKQVRPRDFARHGIDVRVFWHDGLCERVNAVETLGGDAVNGATAADDRSARRPIDFVR